MCIATGEARCSGAIGGKQHGSAASQSAASTPETRSNLVSTRAWTMSAATPAFELCTELVVCGGCSNPHALRVVAGSLKWFWLTHLQVLQLSTLGCLRLSLLHSLGSYQLYCDTTPTVLLSVITSRF